MWRVGVLVALAVALTACSSTSSSSSSSSSQGSSTTTAPATSVPGSTTAPSWPGIGSYVALWPFRNAADAQAWYVRYKASGTDAWHLDAGTTALRFTMGYLGYSEINAVVKTTTSANGAHVSVGFRPSSTVTSTSAVIHLVRWGAVADAPWEVVGTDDTTFSLTMPAYGSAAHSPLAVGGTITGVDENISVTVRQPSSTGPIGTFCCQPAGGSGSPWTATAAFTGGTDPALTVVAATGGHVQKVERFTVTGIVTSGG
jgi:hypothetical protein